MNASEDWQPWRQAWEQALYGIDGLYRHEHPASHFRTSPHSSPMFARAIATLVRRLGLDSVTDLGAGSGELLIQLHAIAPDLQLCGVELRRRPGALPDEVGWLPRLPAEIPGLILGNEFLDNVPCVVVELDSSADLRIVEVQRGTGEERLGEVAPDDVRRWVDRWWPLLAPGERAEVGLARELVWADACRRAAGGAALAIDYGHLRATRPAGGTLASYRWGRQTPLDLDGQHDVTAHVAMDSLAAAVGGELHSQREMLHDLGVHGIRPPLTVASTDPAGYVRALSAASEAADLTASPGLGDFHWLLSPPRRDGKNSAAFPGVSTKT